MVICIEDNLCLVCMTQDIEETSRIRRIYYLIRLKYSIHKLYSCMITHIRLFKQSINWISQEVEKLNKGDTLHWQNGGMRINWGKFKGAYGGQRETLRGNIVQRGKEGTVLGLSEGGYKEDANTTAFIGKKSLSYSVIIRVARIEDYLFGFRGLYIKDSFQNTLTYSVLNQSYYWRKQKIWFYNNTSTST